MDVLIGAFATQLDEIEKVLADIGGRNWDNAVGVQLDGIGSIVGLTRGEAATYPGIETAEIDDDTYRLLLKFKALRNSATGTYEELSEALRLLFDAKIVYYTDNPNGEPATFLVSVLAPFTTDILNFLQNNKVTLKPAGVAARINYVQLEFFGFSDTNDNALGFGKGKFAQEVV
jgi:hypothetical protein